MTRDSLLPILAPLYRAAARRLSLAALVAELPPRFTASDRLQGVAPTMAAAFLARITEDPAPLLSAVGLGALAEQDLTDGLRLTDANGDILHLRPSGNAPEFRIYVEASSPEAAQRYLQDALHLLPGLVK